MGEILTPMEAFSRLLDILDANVILCLLPLLLTVMLVERLFKGKFRTRQVINLVRWLVVFYTAISILYFLTGMVVCTEEFAVVQRATGRYAAAYWLMFACATVFPFTLVYDRIGRKPIYILLVVFLMKIGYYFERFVILATSLHRDYAPDDDTSGWLWAAEAIAVFFLQGFILAILSLAALDLLARFKASEPKPNS